MSRLTKFEYPIIIPVEDVFTVIEAGSAEGKEYAMVANAVLHEDSLALEYLQNMRKGAWLKPLKWVNTINTVRVEKQNPHYSASMERWVWLFVKA